MDEKIKKEVSQVLKNVSHNVRLTYFSKEKGCPLCKKQQEIIAEIVSLSRKLELQVHDIEKSGKEAERYHIEKVPATAVIGKKDYGIRFYGLTGGHEFTSLINAIIMVGSDRSGLHPELEKLMKKIEQPVHIEVMVTLTCPYCPQAVHAAQQLAMVNDHINADMVDSAEFPDLAQRYEVFETPKTVINETHSFVGAQPVQAVYLEVLKAVDPREYERIDQMIRETQGHRHVKKPELQTKYDTIIVGGGPAAMSAAIYAARKEMNVLLVAKELGGQITYTANVENYLGLPNLSGRNMRDQFLVHMEQYPIAESVGANVLTVGKKNSTFIVKTEGKKEYKGNSVIFCTGKEYRRLGVPGEEKFIGRGIAFCATCDAPLYRGKKVAVVGGGNSAFTAVRDLINFADEIHLVHRKDSFKADISLVKHVKSTKKVLLHTNMVVQEFLGDDTLRGVRLKSTQEQEALDIEVDGVFLEIGLTPNTESVKDLIQLNARGEIPVKSDNSTALSGFFAAGDVTDVPEKQIIVAAGEGAKAAISAYKYLIEEQLVEKKTVVEEWE